MPFDTQSPVDPALRLFDAPGLVALDLPARELLLDPLLFRGTLALLRGPKAVGKSYMALEVAHAVASGGEALIWTAPTPRRVLHVDADMPLALVKERLAAISRGRPAPALTLLAADAQDTALPSLGTVTGLARFEGHLAGVDLLILDGLSSLVGPGGGPRWLAFAAALRAWRRRGLAVLMVETGRLRGSAQVIDSLIEVTIALVKPFDHAAEEGGRCDVLIETARTHLGDAAAPAEACLTRGGETGVWNAFSKQHAELDRAFRLHAAGFTYSEIARRLGTSRTRAYRLVEQARESSEAFRAQRNDWNG